MVFVAGPRQVGKTTLAKQLIDTGDSYLNWDIYTHRDKILKQELPDTDMWVFDELHKYKKWRQFLKGLYDEFGKKKKILVIGSAKLDQYRYGGDSLQGRYHFLRIYPLSISELGITLEKDFMDLLNLGGFPEPFFGASLDEARRWSREYRSRLIEEEVKSIENIRDLGTLELTAMRLPELVGSPLSINSLKEDLQAGYTVVSNWLKILERNYMIFRIKPFTGGSKIRSVKKEQKHYHYDWTLVLEEGLKFENFVAVHLLKWVHFQQDTLGYDYELNYFRDIDGREVDFVVTKDNKPVVLIEAKWNDSEISKSLKYLKHKFPDVESWQISAAGKKDYQSQEGIRVCHALKFLSKLI